MHCKGEAKRVEAVKRCVEWISGASGEAAAATFSGLIGTYVLLFSVRESGKYYVAKLFDLCRRLVRQQGQQLHKASLVDSPDDVFDLTLDDLHLAHYAIMMMKI